MKRRIERTIGIVLGLLLGVAIVVAFLFLGSRDTIDDPSINEGGPQTTIQAPAPNPEPTTGPAPLPGEP